MHLNDKPEFTEFLVNVGELCQRTVNISVAELFWKQAK